MNLTLKNTSCPFCVSELVIANLAVTCTDGCNLDAKGWHKDTQKRIDSVIEWQRTFVDKDLR